MKIPFPFFPLNLVIGLLLSLCLPLSFDAYAKSFFPDKTLFTDSSLKCTSWLGASEDARILFRSVLIESDDSPNRYEILGSLEPIPSESVHVLIRFWRAYSRCLLEAIASSRDEGRLAQYVLEAESLVSRFAVGSLSIGEFNQAMLSAHHRLLLNFDRDNSKIVTNPQSETPRSSTRLESSNQAIFSQSVPALTTVTDSKIIETPSLSKDSPNLIQQRSTHTSVEESRQSVDTKEPTEAKPHRQKLKHDKSPSALKVVAPKQNLCTNCRVKKPKNGVSLARGENSRKRGSGTVSKQSSSDVIRNFY